MTQQQTV